MPTTIPTPEEIREGEAAVAAAEEALKLAKEHRQAIISADVARPRGFQGNG